MDKVLMSVIAIAIVAGAVLGVWWLVWLLWCYVMGSVWPAGPENIVQPGYWLFVGAWVLTGLVFGRFRSSKD